MTFAIITPGLFVGAFAERMKFSAIMWFSGLWCLLVYMPIPHMVWGEAGFFSTMGVFDFAGGIVVHITAGTAALVAAILVGKRQGYPERPMPPHNMTMNLIGTAMLWVGWFGFNGGSALAANGQAAMAVVVTQISPSVLGFATGAIAGLAAITPASGWVGPMGAMAIGFVASVVAYWESPGSSRPSVMTTHSTWVHSSALRPLPPPPRSIRDRLLYPAQNHRRRRRPTRQRRGWNRRSRLGRARRSRLRSVDSPTTATHSLPASFFGCVESCVRALFY